MEIKVGSQVILRQAMRDTGNLIKFGEVVSIQGAKAKVYLPADRVRKDVLLKSLELASNRYPGRTRVQVDPLKRRIL